MESVEAGLGEPPSLHPVIDPLRCLGSSSCVTACPEEALGIVNGKAVLTNAAACIGHGACQAACPTNSIQLVFGTAERGVDLPVVGADFQSSMPGIFIAGELGGMGLIANAIEQGRQAIEAISQRAANRSPALDVVIVGSGPAGIAASLAASARKLNYVTIEQESLGGTVAHYPRGKLVMTRPVKLPIIGRVRMRETSKEALLTFWRNVQKRTSLNIRFGERVDAVSTAKDGFEVTTSAGVYRARAVLLAIGRRGQNVRLASQLTGWSIDILTEAEESERRQKEFASRTEIFVQALEVDEMFAQLLASEGFESVEEIAYVDQMELASIEGLNDEIADELQARAKDFLEKKAAELEAKRVALGVQDDVKTVPGLTAEMLVALGEKDVKTLEDFAGFTGDDLRGWFETKNGERVREPGILESFALTQEQADALILNARIAAGWIEAPPEPEVVEVERDVDDLSNVFPDRS